MVFRCPKGAKKIFRFKGRLRLGGCGRMGRFIKNGVKEVVKFPKKKK